MARLAVGPGRAPAATCSVTPDKTQYGVRETVKTTVRVSQGGKPAAGAEIAFAAVDEGLLALQDNRSWDLLDAMMAPRPWGVETATAQGEIIGRRHYGRKALPPGGGGGRKPHARAVRHAAAVARHAWCSTPTARRSVEVPLNDSLTSFRLVAVADAGADRFGTGSASVRVTQDLQLLPGPAAAGAPGRPLRRRLHAAQHHGARDDGAGHAGRAQRSARAAAASRR